MERGRMSLAIALAALTASACASQREARDFSGSWVPLNRYAAHSEAIPLDRLQVFQATPMDGTLRQLLARWARTAGRRLDYRHPFDFTLHEPVRGVHASSLAEAVHQLGRAFGGQGVAIVLEDDRLVVEGQDGG